MFVRELLLASVVYREHTTLAEAKLHWTIDRQSTTRKPQKSNRHVRPICSDLQLRLYAILNKIHKNEIFLGFI